MIEFHRIWVEQCEGARGIKEQFGLQKALGYLIGEKLVNFLRAVDTRSEFAQEVPAFVAEINDIFEPQELQAYLSDVRRIGAMGHVATDEEYEVFRQAGAIDAGPVKAAEDIVILEHVRELLLA